MISYIRRQCEYIDVIFSAAASIFLSTTYAPKVGLLSAAPETRFMIKERHKDFPMQEMKLYY